MKETPLAENEIQLTAHHRVGFDKLNKTLSFKYQKRDGRGRNAELIDEWGYGNERYFSSFKILVKRILENDFDELSISKLSDGELKDLKQVLEKLEEIDNHIEKLAEEIGSKMDEKIIINIEQKTKKKAKVNGMEIEDDEEIDGDDD